MFDVDCESGESVESVVSFASAKMSKRKGSGRGRGKFVHGT